MLTHILKLFRATEEPTATAEDYEEVFSSDAGQRVLLDLMERYRVGKASFSFDKTGRIDIEASARSDAAKVIVADIVARGQYRDAEAEKPARTRRDDKISRLPNASTTI